MFSWAFGSEPAQKPKPKGLPPGLMKLVPRLSDSQVDLVVKLCSPELGQKHLFEHWPVSDDVDSSPVFKRKFVEQLEALDKAYHGGLTAYIQKAKRLVDIDKSKGHIKSFSGWEPTVPTGQTFEFGTEEFEDVESIGFREIASVGFVLVASGVKLGLPTELATGTTYLQLCVQYILAIQKKFCGEGKHLPLCIAVSPEDYPAVVKALKSEEYAGLAEGQVSVIKELQRMPAFSNSEGKLALDPNDSYKLLVKSHGHGDIHALLHSYQVADKWHESGVKWITVIADTNALAYHNIPLALGVSIKHDLIMNTLAIPRKAKEESTAITKLVNKTTDETWTIHAEYDLLDPLLRANGHDGGETNDKETGLSPFPRPTSMAVFKAEPYLAALENTDGIMPEHVRPKYADESKTSFKTPAAIECSMNDFPTALNGTETHKVGFTCVPADVGYAPVTNSIADVDDFSDPQVAATAEASLYGYYRKVLKSLGCKIEECEPKTFHGIEIVPGPHIVVKPEVACCLADYKKIFTEPEKVKINSKSSLVLKGPGSLVIESIDLDGALVIDSQEKGEGVLRDLWVKNKGWTLEPDEEADTTLVTTRGYKFTKKDTSNIVFKDTSICAIM